MVGLKRELILRLRVLRGVGLAPQDYYGGLREASSDPFCVIIVNGKEIGRTSTRTKTLNPTWADAASSFRFVTTHAARVRVCIRDWDVTKEDDPMGEVSFVVGDIEKERRGKSFSPNKWFNVVPTGDSPSLGKIQLGIMLDEHVPPPTKVVAPAGVRNLKLGPNADLAKASSASTPVFLHVYDVGHTQTIANLNRVGELTVGGVFHCAIQVYSKEYSFGGTKRNQSGIFASNPTKCPLHSYRESYYLGDCYLPKAQVTAILQGLIPRWKGNTYDIIRKNCCSFSDEFTIELGVGQLPSWTNRLAKIGAALQDTLRLESNAASEAIERFVADDPHYDVTSLLLEHVMAVRMQTAFRARKARRIHSATKSPR
ncbi:hypothetical protein CTAYLR_004514 [Chrysophaeum taylorii]|uniref:C2 domain-containing protein n=1 Tax=Chrysophaeum taylorii TaxID=2483200 RepID=A0AAD7XQ40_9STRA|nr:hypothetical protein CTAYLR_004514 [Chrysophaeum taylorii]